MKAHGEMEVQRHSFITSALMGVTGQPQGRADLPTGERTTATHLKIKENTGKYLVTNTENLTSERMIVR
jgi:hypothetical protein